MSRQTFAAALLMAGLMAGLLATVGPAHAADEHGHDHGESPPAANSNGPKRLPDGSVFLPKPAQRQIGLRTSVAQVQALPRAVELAGKVVMDPNAGGKVQPTLAGRIAPGPRGLPTLGQAVRQGEVLAYVLPTIAGLDAANQRAQLADLRAQLGLADKRLARLQALADTVPRKEIEAAEAERAGLAERLAALGSGLGQREALLAPVAGVIASATVVSGQVVEPRELLFEVINPARLQVQALAFDATLAGNIAAAYVPLGADAAPGAEQPNGQKQLALTFIGAAHALREQALPLLFKAQGASGLVVGQTLKVVVQTRATLQGVALPAAALLKNPANQPIVWVKTGAESFAPRVVRAEPLDAARIAVTAGLQAGDRVVTQGANLLNQIR